MEPIAFLNGRFLPLREARLSILDDGIVQGATLTERIRTFAHRPYLLEKHLQRLRGSLQMTGVAAVNVVDDLPAHIDTILTHNVAGLEDWQDLSIVIFVTPGGNLALTEQSGSPTVGVHTTVIPPAEWGRLTGTGVTLVTPAVHHLPQETLDPRIKHRSRLHWFVAGQQARQQHPGAMALLLDDRGHVTETASGNLMVFDGSRLLTPRPERVLGGISQQVVSRLADSFRMETVATDLCVDDVINGREAFLTSTGYCLLPVVSLNGQPIGTGHPGALADQLLQAWSSEVGLDIRNQQRRAARPPKT